MPWLFQFVAFELQLSLKFVQLFISSVLLKNFTQICVGCVMFWKKIYTTFKSAENKHETSLQRKLTYTNRNQIIKKHLPAPRDHFIVTLKNRNGKIIHDILLDSSEDDVISVEEVNTDLWTTISDMANATLMKLAWYICLTRTEV